MTTPAVSQYLETVRKRDEEARRIMSESGFPRAELPIPASAKSILAEIGEIARTVTGHASIELEPSVSEDAIILVGRDMRGRVRIKVELAKEDLSPEWVPWLTRWVARKSQQSLKLVT